MVWDYKNKDFVKQAEKDALWRLERAINYGDAKQKLNAEEVKKYLHKLNIPQERRDFLELVLCNKKF